MANKIKLSVPTVDALLKYFGDWPKADQIRRLSRQEFVQLAEVVGAAARLQPAVAPKDTVYLGGWIAGNLGVREHSQLIARSLLYYDSLLLHDPLAEMFATEWRDIPDFHSLRGIDRRMVMNVGVQMWAGSGKLDIREAALEALSSLLIRVLDDIRPLLPLIEEGTIVLWPQWPTIKDRLEPLFSSVRHDVQRTDMARAVEQSFNADDLFGVPRWDNLRGGQVAPSGGIDSRDLKWRYEPEYFHLAKTLAIADASGALYVPQTRGDLGLLNAKGRQIPPRLQMSPQLLETVVELLLPDIDLTVVDAVRVRSSQDAFEDWRRALRDLDRNSDGDSRAELESRVEDALLPIAERVRRTSGAFERAKASVAGEGVKVGILTTITAAAAYAVAPQQSLQAAAPVAAAGVLSWLVDIFRPVHLGGRERVIHSMSKLGERKSR